MNESKCKHDKLDFNLLSSIDCKMTRAEICDEFGNDNRKFQQFVFDRKYLSRHVRQEIKQGQYVDLPKGWSIGEITGLRSLLIEAVSKGWSVKFTPHIVNGEVLDAYIEFTATRDKTTYGRVFDTGSFLDYRMLNGLRNFLLKHPLTSNQLKPPHGG